jgi:UDP-galactopyranose mutase
MKHASLPANMEIDGITHIQHYRDARFVVYQNYTEPVPSSENPLQPVPRVKGQNLFHLYRIINHEPGEELGGKIGSYTSLDAEITQASRTQ